MTGLEIHKWKYLVEPQVTERFEVKGFPNLDLPSRSSLPLSFTPKLVFLLRPLRRALNVALLMVIAADCCLEPLARCSDQCKPKSFFDTLHPQISPKFTIKISHNLLRINLIKKTTHKTAFKAFSNTWRMMLYHQMIRHSRDTARFWNKSRHN